MASLVALLALLPSLVVESSSTELLLSLRGPDSGVYLCICLGCRDEWRDDITDAEGGVRLASAWEDAGGETREAAGTEKEEDMCSSAGSMGKSFLTEIIGVGDEFE